MTFRTATFRITHLGAPHEVQFRVTVTIMSSIDNSSASYQNILLYVSVSLSADIPLTYATNASLQVPYS